MKTKEAKKIIHSIVLIQMQGMGIEVDTKKILDLSKYSLQDLLDANRKVELSNKKSEIMTEYYKKKLNKTSSSRKVQMTIDDRGIAAFYTLINFSPSTTAIMSYNSVHLAVISDFHLRNDEDNI